MRIFFYISDESISKNYFGIPFKSISITTDEKSNLQSITIHFKEVINREFYDLFIQTYDYPSHILVVEKTHIINESNQKDDFLNQYLSKGKIELSEGKFEENPLFIIWRREHFQIKINLGYEQK